MKTPRVLIVDDESSLRTALFRALDKRSFQVLTASSYQEALLLSSSDKNIDLALIDLRLPDGNGLELMSELKTKHSGMKTIILTGFGSIETAVEATQKGASHFMTKPFNLEEVLSNVSNLLSQKSLESENTQLRNALHQQYKFENIIGQSEQIKDVLNLVNRVAESDSTVLITGESGTGKELIAKAIHFNSSNSNSPFVPVNCGAIPSELLESELFGHVKGAFTGAVANRVGRFELAHGGTIFFDEIGDMSPHLQVKLLRVLQDKKFERVGDTKTIQTDVRIIAATNVDLEKAVAEGRFREDLYYRLNIIPINVPSLRDRVGDLPILIDHFINKFNKNKKQQLTGFSQDTLDVLAHYPWPGNIRELENLVERLSILKGGGEVGTYDLPERYRINKQYNNKAEEIVIPENGIDFNSAVNSYENALIMKALEKTGWNRNQAAILLKLNRTTLVEKIKKKGLKQAEA